MNQQIDESRSTKGHIRGHRRCLTDKQRSSTPALSPEEWLQRKLHGNELAAAMRRLADRAEMAPYKAHVYACINTILIDAARTPQRDRTRILRSMREFGGGLVADIAECAKLPAPDVERALGLLVEEKAAYRRGNLYFLTDDPTAR
jgi:hypothetical protein